MSLTLGFNLFVQARQIEILRQSRFPNTPLLPQFVPANLASVICSIWPIKSFASSMSLLQYQSFGVCRVVVSIGLCFIF
jgi:undecaprenyl pyrophosphate phosphatase UppP